VFTPTVPCTHPPLHCCTLQVTTALLHSPTQACLAAAVPCLVHAVGYGVTRLHGDATVALRILPAMDRLQVLQISWFIANVGTTWTGLALLLAKK
jgi:hypothetical protein